MLEKVDKDVDILASGIAITEERKTKVNFSDPYLETYGVAAVRADGGINDKAALGKVRVAIQGGDYNQQFVEPLVAQGQGSLQKQTSAFLAFRQFLNKDADAAVANVHVMRFYAKQYDTPINEILLTEAKNNLGFAVGKRNPELLAQINAGLAKLKASGEYQKLVEKWFGSA